MVKMVSILFPSEIISHFQVLIEHFDAEQLQDAIKCSEECATLLNNPRDSPATSPLSEHRYCPDHPLKRVDVFCRQCETELCSDCDSHSTHQYTDIATATAEEIRKLGEATDHVMSLLQETRRAVAVVREMTQRVNNRKERSMDRTREVFNALRKAIDEREAQVITDIKKRADKRENALQVLCITKSILCCIRLQTCACKHSIWQYLLG